MEVRLKHSAADPVRLAFVYIFQKRPGMKQDNGKEGTPKFEVTPIIKPGGENERKLKEAIEAVAKEKYGEKMVDDGDGNKVPNWKNVLKNLDEDRRGLRNGNQKRTQGGDIYDGFEGMRYITARTTKRPGVFDLDRTPLVEEDGKPYAGCYGNVNLDVWALKKQGVKPCIVAELLGVQFVEDGDAFGGGAAPAKADDFDDLSAGEDDGSTKETANADDNPFG